MSEIAVSLRIVVTVLAFFYGLFAVYLTVVDIPRDTSTKPDDPPDAALRFITLGAAVTAFLGIAAMWHP